jgi:putative oxidoreductase
MFHADHTLVQILAHLFIATLFIIVGVRNFLNWTSVIKRMTDLSVPLPQLAFPLALAVQFAGAALLAIDYRADIGAVLLIGFTVTVTAFYHRYWTYADARQRQNHFQFLFNNLAVVGGLMLLV